MVEPAHQLIVQVTSVLAFAVAIVAIAIISTSLRKFSRGVVKNAIIASLIQVVILAVSLGAMAYYHVFDVDLTLDIWHVGIMIALAFGLIVVYQIISVSKKFAKL